MAAPLYDEEAESFTVAALIKAPQYLGEINLDKVDFGSKDYRFLFECIMTLWQLNEEINELSIRQEAGDKVPGYIIAKILAELPSPEDVLKYAVRVRRASWRRRAMAVFQAALKEFQNADDNIQDVIDKVRVEMDALNGTGESSRVVKFSDIKVINTNPPTYRMTIKSSRGETASDVIFESTDFKQDAFKRKIRENLRIIPIFPKQFEPYAHGLLQHADVEEVPFGSNSAHVHSCINDWFSTASEAETVEDLQHGYINREGAYWFKSARLITYIQKQTGDKKFDMSRLWAVIGNCGGRRSRVLRFIDKTVRVWGLDYAFFEESEPADGEQQPMVEQKSVTGESVTFQDNVTGEGVTSSAEDDLGWLEA